MSVTVNIKPELIAKKIDQLYEGQMEMLASQILRDCNEFCKMDTGTLILSSLIHSNLKKGKLVWQTPYAARQYYAIETAYKDVNHNASWRWVDVARSRHYEQWLRQAQAITRYY